VGFFNLEDYETVEERLIKFWKDNPNGRVFTRLLEHGGARFIVEASIFRGEAEQHPWATGLAEETVQGRGVNATSALENCETSAIGRALANAGYATKGKRASREEMGKVAAKAQTESLLAETKAKMAQTSGEYVPVPKEDDPWTIRDAKPAATVDEAVKIVDEIIGVAKDKDIPRCTGCHDKKLMSWATGVSAKTKKPWGKFGCFVCKDVVWYEISPSGDWQPQKKYGN
jgi:hypothetical protein